MSLTVKKSVGVIKSCDCICEWNLIKNVQNCGGARFMLQSLRAKYQFKCNIALNSLQRARGET